MDGYGLSPARGRRQSSARNGSKTAGRGRRTSSKGQQASQSMSPRKSSRSLLVDYSQKPAQDARLQEDATFFKTPFFGSASLSDLNYLHSANSDSEDSSKNNNGKDNNDHAASQSPKAGRSSSPKRNKTHSKKATKPADVKMQFRIRNPNVAPKQAPPKPAAILLTGRQQSHELRAIGEGDEEGSKSSLQLSGDGSVRRASDGSIGVRDPTATMQNGALLSTLPPPSYSRGVMNPYGTTRTDSLLEDSAGSLLKDDNNSQNGDSIRGSISVEDLDQLKSRQNNEDAASPPPGFVRSKSAATTSSHNTSATNPNRLLASAMFAVQDLPPSTLRQQKKLQREKDRSSVRSSGPDIPVSIDVSPRRHLRRTKSSSDASSYVVPAFAGGGAAPRRKLRRSRSTDGSCDMIKPKRREKEEDDSRDDPVYTPTSNGLRSSMVVVLDGRPQQKNVRKGIRRSKSGENPVDDVTDQLRRRADGEEEVDTNNNQAIKSSPLDSKSVARMGGTRIKRFNSREDRAGGLSTTSGGKELRRLVNESKRAGVIG